MSLDRFADLSLPFIEKAGIAYGSREALLPALEIVKPKVKHLSDVPAWIAFLFTEDYPFDEEAVQKTLRKPGATDRLRALGEAFATLETWDAPAIEATLRSTAETAGVKTGEFIHPARVAASGKSVGPGLYELLAVLGKERVLARFASALSRFPA